jgi:hypothetical protein
MSKYFFGCALAGALALTASSAAQNPPTQQPTPRTPTTQDPARTQDQARMVTVEGCLMREADVPGRRPNVAERAGITEDYILTSTKMVKGSAPAAPSTGQTRPGDTPTGTAGTPAGTAGTQGAMYEVEGIDDERLKQHVGRRVQIDGTFENVDRARATPERGTPADDLVEIRATTIRQVAGECPAKQ